MRPAFTAQTPSALTRASSNWLKVSGFIRVKCGGGVNPVQNHRSDHSQVREMGRHPLYGETRVENIKVGRDLSIGSAGQHAPSGST